MSTRNITAFYRVLLIGFEGDAMFRQDIQDLLSTQFVKRVRRYSVALVFIHPVSSSLRLVSSFSVHLFPMLKQSWIARSVTFSVWVWGVWLPFTHGASMWGILELWWSDAQGSPVSILIPVSMTQSWWICYRKQLLRPAILNGVLAPDENQRLRYKGWLHVYGKNKTRIPVRMEVLLVEYKVSFSQRSFSTYPYRFIRMFFFIAIKMWCGVGMRPYSTTFLNPPSSRGLSRRILRRKYHSTTWSSVLNGATWSLGRHHYSRI